MTEKEYPALKDRLCTEEPRKAPRQLQRFQSMSAGEQSFLITILRRAYPGENETGCVLLVDGDPPGEIAICGERIKY